jgi:hypothetical protein
LTVIPKLSILILLFELYLQIDSFEGFFYAYYPFNYYMDATIMELNNTVWPIVWNFFELFGGLENYEYLSLTYPNIYMPVDAVIPTAKEYIVNIHISNLIEMYRQAHLDDFWAYFFNLQVEEGGGSVALHNLLFVSSLLSLIIGTVLGLAQSQIKRLLA